MFRWDAIPAQSSDNTEVAIETRVVAAGVAFVGGRRKLRMTLVLSPVSALDRGDWPKASLEIWPIAIENKLRTGLKVWVSPVRTGPGRPVPDPSSSTPIAVTLARPLSPPTEMNQIVEAWQHLMAPVISGGQEWPVGATDNDKGQWKKPWSTLVGFINANNLPASPRPTAGPPPRTTPTLPEPDKERIITVPRGDIALFLSVWRARIVLAALGKKVMSDPTCERAGVRSAWDLQASTIKLVNDWDDRSIAGSKAGANTQSDVDILLADTIKEAVKHTATQSQARLDYLLSDSRATALEKLSQLDVSVATQEKDKCRCSAPAELLEAVALTNQDALDRLLARFLLLQGLDLSLDAHLSAGLAAQTARAVDAAKKLEKHQEAGSWVGGIKDREADQPGKPKVANDHWDRPPVGGSHYLESRFFALQANPALARVFNFVVDVEAELTDFPQAEAQAFFEADTVDFDAPEQQNAPLASTTAATTTRYLYLACGLPSDKQPRLDIWSTAKLRVPDDLASTSPGHFLPCLREEIDIAAAAGPDTAHRDKVHDRRAVTGNRMMLPMLLDGAIRQFDGVVDLGAGRRTRDHWNRRPRFDIVSLEAIGALEHQLEVIRSLRRLPTPGASPQDVANAAAKASLEEDIPERPTLMTEGLLLIDRWRGAEYAAAQADQAMQEIDYKTGRPLVLDAADLSVGYRLDVGVRPAKSGRGGGRNPRYIWRSLSARKVEYDCSRKPGLIEDVLKRLGYGHGSHTEQRIRLDAAPVMAAARQATGPGPKRVFPEEIVASWNGEPLGIQCRQEKLFFDPRKGFGVSATYSYPEGRGYQIPKLKFGGRYRFGLRQVYLGGVVTPLARAAAIYDECAGGTLALPGALPPESRGPGSTPVWNAAKTDVDAIHGRRFLRHERLKAPEAVLPMSEVEALRERLRDADRVPDGRRNDHFFGYPLEGALSAVLRTAEKIEGSSNELDTSRVVRIIVPPSESQDFALRHGVLPAVPRVYNGTLVDGLPNVAYYAERGGFPVRDADGRVVRRHKEMPRPPLDLDQTHCLPRRNPDDAKTPGQFKQPDPDLRGGDAVFKVEWMSDAKHSERMAKYFPDPAADNMVLAIRRVAHGANRKGEVGNDKDYLAGQPRVINLHQTGKAYPNDAAPLYLEIKAMRGTVPESRLDPTLVSHAMIISDATAGVITEDQQFRARPWNDQLPETPALHVGINLLPGEDYYLDIWCLPTKKHLEDWFDVVESAAMLSVARGRDLSKMPGAYMMPGAAADQCVAGLEKLAYKDVTAWREALKRYDPQELVASECGAGAQDLPCAAVLAEIAALLYGQMSERPIREIAAVRSIRLTHAVSAPLFKPEFTGTMPALPAALAVCLGPTPPPKPDLDRTGLALMRQRFDPSKLGANGPTLDDLRKEFVAKTDVIHWAATPNEEKASDLLVGGNIRLDLDTVQSLVVLADIAHPRTSRFDEPERGRPRHELGGPPARADNEELYGFRVGPDGRVQFVLQREELIRLSNLAPAREVDRRRRGNELVDVLRAEIEVLQDGKPVTQLVMRDSIDLKRSYVPSDTKARRLVLTMLAYSRFHDHFAQIKHKVDGDETKRISTNALDRPKSDWRVSRSSTDQEKAAPPLRLSGHRIDTKAGLVELWIPATERPKAIDPKSFVPAFVWRETQHVSARNSAAVVVANQRTVVRLRFRRPWFSSGEGERLGIVLWPPGIFNGGPVDADFKAEDGKSTPNKERIQKYMTRWGADPIGESNTASGKYMPLEAFADAFCADRTDVERVANVGMPLPKEDSAPGAKPDFGQVSLLTYEPRFDVRDETWYVDVEIGSGGVPGCFVRFGLVRYQPHAAPDLQLSEPTTTMVQVLPERDVTVRRMLETIAGAETEVIHVDVEGPAAMRAAPEPLIDGDTTNDMRHRPVLRPRLLYVEKIEAEQEEVRPAECIEDERWLLQKIPAEPEGVVVPTRGGRGLKWSHRFVLDPREVPRGKHFRVIVDEIDLRLPTKPNEKVLVRSGPRFAATIDVPPIPARDDGRLR